MNDEASKKGKGEQKSISLQYLEKTRNFHLIVHNVYPLPHVYEKRKKRKRDHEDESTCCCTEPQGDPEDEKHWQCIDVSCLNFATYTECNQTTCPVGKYCQNQRIQEARYPDMEPFDTNFKGYGIRVLEPIVAHQFVTCYYGEIIDEKELNVRIQAAVARHEVNYYYLEMESGIYCDARVHGGLSRFINHSCDPNLITEKWTVRGEIQVAFFAKRDIAQGEELTIDYQWESSGGRNLRCRCEAENCRGTIAIVDEKEQEEGLLETTTGIFREPRQNETGAMLIHRRIRIWRPRQKTYLKGSIVAYNAEADQHVIRIESNNAADLSKLHEEENLEKEEREDGMSDTDSIEGKFISSDSREVELSLASQRWHVYEDFEGQSDAEIEKLVFAIPKRQRSTVSSDENHESTSEKRQLRESNPQPSSADTEPSVGFFRSKTHLPTNFLLIKNITPEYTKSKLAAYLSNGLKASSNEKTQIKRVEFIKFPNGGLHWALVECPSFQMVQDLKRHILAKKALGLNSRCFFAYDHEQTQFHRAEIACSKYRLPHYSSQKEEMKEETPPPPANVHVIEPKGSLTVENKLKSHIYPMGTRLNWHFTEEQLQHCTKGMKWSLKVDRDLCRKLIRMINKIAMEMKLDRMDGSHAIVFFHRYRILRAIDMLDCPVMISACLFLVIKMKGRDFRPKDFFRHSFDAHNSLSSSSTTPSQSMFHSWKRQIATSEETLLLTLGYDCCHVNPYHVLDSMLTNFKDHRDHKLIRKESRRICSESHVHYSLWLMYPADYIALASVVVSTAMATIAQKNEETLDPQKCPRPSWLPEIDVQFTTERDWVDGAMAFFLDEYTQRASTFSPRPSHDQVKALCHVWTKHQTKPFESESTTTDEANTETTKAATSYQCTQFRPMKTPVESEVLEWIKESKDQLLAVDEVAREIESVTDTHSIGRWNAPTVSSSHRTSRFQLMLSAKSSRVLFLSLPAVPVLKPHGGSHHQHLKEPDRFVQELCFQQYSEHCCPWGIVQSHGLVGPSSYHSEKHTLVLECPISNLANVFKRGIPLPPVVFQHIIKDLVRVMACHHNQDLVLRHLSVPQLYLFPHRVKLGQVYRCGRFLNSSGLCRLNEADSQEHLDPKSAVFGMTAPEILLGSRTYSKASDSWLLGCFIALLCLSWSDKCHTATKKGRVKMNLFRGKDRKSQLEYIYRACGSPDAQHWPSGQKLPKFKHSPPQRKYKNRLLKTLRERRDAKYPVPESLLDLIGKLVTLDPEARATPQEILKHEYFTLSSSQSHSSGHEWTIGVRAVMDADPKSSSFSDEFVLPTDESFSGLILFPPLAEQEEEEQDDDMMKKRPAAVSVDEDTDKRLKTSPRRASTP